MSEQSLALAAKLNSCLIERQMTPATLAELMGVKAPSVYDWLKYGRIAKHRIPELAKIFDRPLSWWFDSDIEEALLSEDEKQLLMFYRQSPGEAKAKLLQDANWHYNQSRPDTPSVANPFPKQKPPNRSG